MENENLNRKAPNSANPQKTPRSAPKAEQPKEPGAATPPRRSAPKKGRPRHRKGYGLLGIPHILVTLVWLGIIAAAGISLGRLAWLCAADVLAFGKPDREVVVTIREEDTVDTIAKKLEDAGLVEYPELFKLYAKLTDAREDISAGEFTLNNIYDYHALVNSMTTYSTARSIVEVVIPEGYSCAQIFRLLEEKGVCKVADLEAYAADGELDDYWFLEGLERGDRYCLEGYLFPDTYSFYTNDDPRRVLEKLLDDFEYRFTDTMMTDLTTLNEKLSAMMGKNGYDEDYISTHQFDIHKLVIVASMVERETANSTESYTIASVIYNRLTNLGAYPYLNIDASIIYALDEFRELTKEDLQLDSPYNTYTHMGLTPGPISNPGLSSLQAALNPDDTDYYYYALDPSVGLHHFSKTLEEHEQFLASLEE